MQLRMCLERWVFLANSEKIIKAPPEKKIPIGAAIHLLIKKIKSLHSIQTQNLESLLEHCKSTTL